MSFAVTLLYLTVLIATPGALVPELAQYRIQWVFGSIALLLTAALVPYYGYPIRNATTLLMVAFMFQIVMSRLMQGWLGGMIYALSDFGAIGVVFFLLVAGQPATSRLKWIAAALYLPALYAVFRGIGALYFNWQPDTYILSQNLLDDGAVVVETVQRIRFLGFFADPNDLAQLCLISVPFIAMFWKKGNPVRNFLVVLPVLLYLFLGMYLTHSRGVLVGLVVAVMAYLYNRFNKTVMTFGSVAVAVAGIGANFSGGRAISFSSGSDRIEAWGAGFSMLRDNPLFGVGFNLFLNHNELTAHNSVVLCFAELGLIGLFIWLGLLISTLLSLNSIVRRFSTVPAARDLVRWALATRMSLLAFIATGWFLSRTYSIIFYVLLAMGVIIEQASQRLMLPRAASEAASMDGGQSAAAMPPPRPGREWHWAKVTAMVQIFSLMLLYVMVRARWAQ